MKTRVIQAAILAAVVLINTNSATQAETRPAQNEFEIVDRGFIWCPKPCRRDVKDLFSGE